MKNLRFSLFAILPFFTFSGLLASDCGSASQITPRQSLSQNVVSGSFSGETYSGDTECTGPGSQADSWFRFTANATKMFVRVIGSGDLDLALEVLDGCGGTVLSCANNTGAAGSETASLSGLSIGNTYYFRTYHVGGSPATSQGFTAAVSFIPTVQLQAEDCGINDYTTNDILTSVQPVNTSSIVYYQWRFEELEAPFNVYEEISDTPTNPNYRLKFFNEIEYNRSYDVSIRLAVNPDATVGDYGPSCTIQLQEDVLSTQMEQQYASTFVDFCDVIGADDVGGADRYRWNFNDFETPLNVYGDGNQRLLRISKVPGIKLGKTYVVSVFAEVAGMESPAGTFRFINTNNTVPNTGLRTDIYPCGGTYPINSQVQAIEICKAENYTWRFRNTSQVQPDLIYVRTGGNRFIRLEWVTGLIPGDNYDVDVKARQGAKNGDYSLVCNITIGESTAPFLEEVVSFGNNGDDKEGNDGGLISSVNHDETLIEMVLLNNGSSSSEGIVFDIASADVDNTTRIELYDLNGRLVAERTEYVVREGNRISWKVPGFTSGIYLLRAVNGDHVVTKKVSVF